MAGKDHLQQPAIFEEVSVCVAEEKEFSLDPYLLALNGSNIQQYCTMLSWLESQNPRPELFYETEEGVTMPLSLSKVVEDFEIRSSYYEADGTTPVTTFEPVVQLQYDFVSDPEGGLGKQSEPQKRPDLQTDSGRPLFPEGTINNFPKQTEEDEQKLAEDRNARIPQQKFSQQPISTCLSTVQQNKGIAFQGSEQDGAQGLVGLGELQRNMERRAEHHCDSRKVTVHHIIHTRQTIHFNGNAERSFEVREGTHISEETCHCPKSGRPWDQERNLPDSTDLKSAFSETVSCAMPSADGHQTAFTEEWASMFRQLSLKTPPQKNNGIEKPFKCPECGKGFLHKSSIPRHLRIHRRENPSPDSGHEGSFSLGISPLPLQKRSSGGNPHEDLECLKSLADEETKRPKVLCHQSAVHSLVPKENYFLTSEPPKELLFPCSSCGRKLKTKSSFDKHQMMHHAERPFKCALCDKSYIHRNHLKRHTQKHGTETGVVAAIDFHRQDQS